MANVKITELTELAAIDVADNDVFPIVDVGGDTTKKITAASLKTSIAFANDFITYTQLNSNIDSVQSNVVAAEANIAGTDARLVANVAALNDVDTAINIRITNNTAVAASNDFITYTQLNSNINVVQDNVAAIDANVVSISDTGGHTVNFSANLIPSANAVYDLGSATAQWKDLYLTGSTIKLGGITISELAGEGITITGTSGEQANLTTPSLGGVANISAEIEGIDARIAANTLVAASNDFATYTRLQANIDLVQDNVASVTVGTAADTETRLNANLDITQDNVVAAEANVVLVRSNIDSFASTTNTTIDTLSTNLTANLVQATANTDAVETRRADNVFFTLNLTGQPQANIILNDANVEPTSNNTYSLGAPDKVWKDVFIGPGSLKLGDVTISALGTEGITITGESGDQANVTTPNQGGVANVSAELDGLQSRLTTNVTAFTNEDTALQSRLATNVTAFINEDIALQARITANNQTAASNDFITFTRLNANVDIVQDNVATNATDITALETRRTNNIAGAVSTITTSDLTASRALVSDGSGKVAVSAVTSTEIGHLDGVTSAIQTQLNAVEARRAANLVSATFTGEVNMSDDLTIAGNLTINGDQTVINTTNLDVDDTLIMLANGTTGSPTNDIGILFNRGNQGNAAFFYDESGKTFKISDTQDPSSNTTLHPISSSNLDVGRLTAATVEFDGADLSTAITDNVSTLNTSIAAVETRRTNNIAGAVSTITTSDLTASRAIVSDGSGKVAVSTITATELGHLDGVSSAIQTQLNSKIATTDSASNDFVTFTRLDANIDVISSNATAFESRRVANIAGAVSTITTSDLTASRALVSDGSGKVAVSAVTATEIGHLDGVSSAIQTQLDGKQATITGAATTIDDTNLTASRALVSDGSGKVAVSAVTSTELGRLDGVTSGIQTQLNAKLESVGTNDIDDNAVTVGKLAATIDLGTL